MTLSSKINSIRPLTYYAVTVFIAACLVSVYLLYDKLFISSYPLLIIAIFSLLMIWRFGLRFPYIGLVSIERVVQFHLLLTVPLFDVVIINMCAGLIMPYLNKSYRLDSNRLALIRGMSNAAMNAFMMLAAGFLLNYYLALPILQIDLKVVLVILLAAVVVQIMNIGFLATYHFIDNKNISKLLNLTLVLADFIFIPVGVLSALLYQHPDKVLFWLFVFFIVVMLVSFNAIQSTSKTSNFQFNGTNYQSDFLDINSVCLAIMRRITHLFKYDGVYLGAYNKDLQLIELYIKQLKKKQDILSESALIEFSQKKRISNKVIEVKSSTNTTKKIAVMSSPFINQDGAFAFLCIVKKTSVKFSASDLNLFELLIQRYGMGLSYAMNYKNLSEYKISLESKVIKRTQDLEEANIEKSKLVKELQSLAKRDGLTGLYNRRYLDNMIEHFVINPPDCLSLVVIDIDFFKAVNDQYGHESGDEVLKHLATILIKNHFYGMRIIRYGGEEFVLLIQNVQKSDVIKYCQKLLKKVSGYDWSAIEKDLEITISIGMSYFPDVTIEDMFGQADKLLYGAKSSGRNQLKYEYD